MIRRFLSQQCAAIDVGDFHPISGVQLGNGPAERDIPTGQAQWEKSGFG